VSGSTGTTKPATPDVTYTYRPSGLPATRQFMGGTNVPVTYTVREQLHRIGDPAGTTHRFSAAYRYHANGTVLETQFYNAGTPTGAGATKRYKYAFGTASYDALNRLKSADFSSWSGSAWTSTLAHDLTNIAYDRSGNLTALRRYREADTLIDQLTYTNPSASNRLSSIADAIATTPETWDAESGDFTYDPNGNIKASPAPYSLTAATYDRMNLPLSFTRGGTTTVYRYGPDAQRIAKRVGSGNTEVYLREGPLMLAVFTVNGSDLFGQDVRIVLGATTADPRRCSTTWRAGAPACPAAGAAFSPGNRHRPTPQRLCPPPSQWPPRPRIVSLVPAAGLLGCGAGRSVGRHRRGRHRAGQPGGRGVGDRRDGGPADKVRAHRRHGRPRPVPAAGPGARDHLAREGERSPHGA
jgi:hypothetical protein